MKEQTIDLKSLSIGGIYEVKNINGAIRLVRRHDLEKINISQLPRFEKQTISK